MDQELYRIINDYRGKLVDLGIMVEKIFLFGSHVHAHAGEESDIDLLVISEDFRGMDLYERLSLLGRARKGIGVPMDIIGYTEEEIASKTEESFVKYEAIGKGIEILRAK